MNVRHITPEFRRKMMAKRERDAWRARLGRGRYADIVKEIAGVIQLSLEAGNILTPFGLEGPIRHEIRSELCLQRWTWPDADLMARGLMDDALQSLKAERPDWNEGQLEWTNESGTLIERTRCMRCHAPLPEGHYKFCSNLCGSNHSHTLSRQRQEYEDLAAQVVQIRLT